MPGSAPWHQCPHGRCHVSSAAYTSFILGVPAIGDEKGDADARASRERVIARCNGMSDEVGPGPARFSDGRS